jgi:2-amino-4-hydroxy-6-hydroxymethyldihydropteridine diphosphokinase
MQVKSEIKAYIALGSNLGDREHNLRAAIEMLRQADGVRVRSVSSFYETEPVGYTEQPAFINAAAEVMTALSPMELLRLCQDIENRLGRVRTVKWGPRTADLDILLYGDAVMDTPELKIPHPLMHERRFVLEPLAEVAPGAVHPVTGMTISQLLDKAAA